MKFAITFYVLLFTSAICLSQNSDIIKPLNQLDESKYEMDFVDSFDFIVPKVGKTNITLFTASNWGDPGDFLKVEISNSKYSKTLTNQDGWVKFDQNYPVNSELKNMNRIETDLLLFVSDTNQSLLVLFGWSYASDPGLCTVINLINGEIIYNENSKLTYISLVNGTLTFSHTSTIRCYGQLKEN